jgi:predicted nucleotidyltransferase
MFLKLKEKREDILKLAHRHGAGNVRVFGSYVRGEERAESDIDFLVDMEGSLLQRVALIQDLEDMLGRKADVVTEEGLHWYIRERIIKEAVPL